MILINNIKYEVLRDDGNTIDEGMLNEMVTDYYQNFDYIVGDWAYGKVRLKGFNKKGNKSFKPLNDFSRLDQYLKENCAYGCKYFVLEKLVDKDN